MDLKIASWNVNSLNVRLPHVLAWCDAAAPDILALQETKLTDDRFPAEPLREAGSHSVFSGQKTYNGVAILSREAARDVVTDIPALDDPQRRILAATIGDVRLVNLYVVNGSEVGSEKFDYKLLWLEQVTDWLAGEIEAHRLGAITRVEQPVELGLVRHLPGHVQVRTSHVPVHRQIPVAAFADVAELFQVQVTDNATQAEVDDLFES